MIKRCVICDEQFSSEVNRADNVTCSVACRSKLARKRQKAEAERKARLLTSDEQSMMLWLSKHVPDAEHNLRKLKAIYGNEAFLLASESLKALGRNQFKNTQSKI